MRTLLAISVLFVALGCARGARPTGPGAGPVGKGTVYSSVSGESVSVVPLLPPEERKFLVQFNIPGDDHDGKVLLLTATPSGKEFWGRWRGRDIRFIQTERPNGRDVFVVSRMLEDAVIRVEPDTERTRALDAEEVQALYLKQLADGTLSRGEAFDKKFWARDHERQLNEALAAMNTACGAKVAAAISWDAVPDKMLDDGEAIGSYCAGPLAALQSLCDESEEARRTVQARVKRLECRAADSFSARVEADSVVWNIAPREGADPDRDKQFFLDNL